MIENYIKEHEDIINRVAKGNGFDFNITKACEELSELTEVLLKKLNKFGGPNEPAEEYIVNAKYRRM
jgi:hypothetical protein